MLLSTGSVYLRRLSWYRAPIASHQFVGYTSPSARTSFLENPQGDGGVLPHVPIRFTQDRHDKCANQFPHLEFAPGIPPSLLHPYPPESPICFADIRDREKARVRFKTCLSYLGPHRGFLLEYVLLHPRSGIY
jgi:hypothetical protein